MSFTLCSSAAAIAKAGLHANSDVVASGALMNAFSDETEGFINSETRRDWIGSPASANFSGALADVASCDIGNKIANYDSTGYAKGEFNSLININLFKYNKGIAFLKTDEHKEVM